MGDRISIQFRNEDAISPVLYSHWDGKYLVDKALEYLEQCKPTDEPGEVMVGFIRSLTSEIPNYSLDPVANDEDNGHGYIDLDTWTAERQS